MLGVWDRALSMKGKEMINLGDASQVPLGESRCFEIRGRRVAVFHLEDGELRAVDDLCSHAEASLAAGEVEDACVVCPWHGAKFSLETGEALTAPATESVRAYEVHVDSGRIRLGWTD